MGRVTVAGFGSLINTFDQKVFRSQADCAAQHRVIYLKLLNRLRECDEALREAQDDLEELQRLNQVKYSLDEFLFRLNRIFASQIRFLEERGIK